MIRLTVEKIYECQSADVVRLELLRLVWEALGDDLDLRKGPSRSFKDVWADTFVRIRELSSKRAEEPDDWRQGVQLALDSLANRDVYYAKLVLQRLVPRYPETIEERAERLVGRHPAICKPEKCECGRAECLEEVLGLLRYWKRDN